jgi:putative SOS response-associated peptidase YedK
MCGRYTLSLPAISIADLLELLSPDFDFEPRFNIAPTQRLPVVTSAAPKELSLLRWGLVPSWAKDPGVGSKMINARAETLMEKPAFRQALAQRRCLVPVDGFYEWKSTPLGKVPHHIRRTDRGLITFAGLWDVWQDAEGRPIATFTIITVAPNDLMASIHDRMPAIIPADQRAKWLSMSTTAVEASAMLLPYPGTDLEAVAVNQRVNSPRNDGPELLLPPTPSLF